MRPLIIINGAHLKGNYLGTNLLVVGMNGNNQIIPLATGVSQGETGESWTWFLSKLKEQIGEPPNLFIISDRHAAIIQACATVFDNSFHGFCDRHLMMNCNLKGKKLREAPENELCDWAAAKVYDHMLKSANWTVRPIDHLKLFQVFNKLEVHQVDLVAFQCSCRKWQLSRLPCGHVCVVCRVSGLTNCNLWAKPWFKKTTLKSTYQEMVYPLKDPKKWQAPNDLQLVLPPVMIKRPAGRPKNKKRIHSTNQSMTIPSCTREEHLSEEVRLDEDRLRNGRVYMDWDDVQASEELVTTTE
ncbi:transposase, MuDR, MULE transposase domain protein, partial [Tanacetum coccineum]